MKFLPLDYSRRDYLINRSALKLNAEGNETLAGLSRSESATYVQLFDDFTQGVLPTAAEELHSFLAMHDRHTRELPSNWLFSVVYAMSQQHLSQPKMASHRIVAAVTPN